MLIKLQTVAVAMLLGLAFTLQADPPVPMTRADATRKVVTAMVAAAREAGDVKGDPLTVTCIRAAAAAADRLPREVSRSAFLCALGIGLDDSTILRANPLTASFCKQVENDVERKARLALLGSRPTMQGRRDWAQHFVVSCFLTAQFGPQLAEAAGVFKEKNDSLPGGSGFSFGDLNADLAGVMFASHLQKNHLQLATLAQQFDLAQFLPDGKSLREDLSAEAFQRDFGSLEDDRYRKELTRIRKRIENLPVYQKKD